MQGNSRVKLLHSDDVTALTSQGSKEAWLKEILTRIAEVLELQDLGAIQVEVAALGSTYPDLR